MSQELNHFKELLKQDEKLSEAVKRASLETIIAVAKAKGCDISMDDLTDAVSLKGDSGPVNGLILWDEYIIVH